MISHETAAQYLDVIRELEAKPQPLSEFEERRLRQMKLAIREMDEASDIEVGVFDPSSGRRGVFKSVKPSDLDDDGTFNGK